MKEQLIELLFEEYKQECISDELSSKGIELDGLKVNNLDIVISLIGFPKSNTKEYDWNSVSGLPHNPKIGKKMDKNYFNREWLYHPYFYLMKGIEKIQTFEVTKKGLKMKEQNDENLIKAKLEQYVEWLYREFDKCSSNEN